jgi:hypothetical protein
VQPTAVVVRTAGALKRRVEPALIERSDVCGLSQGKFTPAGIGDYTYEQE